MEMWIFIVCPAMFSGGIGWWGLMAYRVKLGKLGHQANSDTRLQTVEIQMRRLLISRYEPSHQDFHCLLS